jgi:hypothetical protein
MPRVNIETERDLEKLRQEAVRLFKENILLKLRIKIFQGTVDISKLNLDYDLIKKIVK